MFGRRIRLALHFCAALAVLVGLAHLVGLPALLAALHGANLSWFGVAAGASLAGIGAWGVGLYVVVASDSDGFGAIAFTQAYLAGLFVRNVVPWGNAGGAVFTGYVLSRASEDSFERVLGSVATWEFLNTLASLAVAVTGLIGYLAMRNAATPVEVLAAVGSVSSAAVAAILVVRYRRGWVTWAVLVLAEGMRETVGRASPRAARVLAEERIQRRLGRFFQSVERTVADRGTMWRSFGAGLAAWTLLPIALVASLHAVGASLGVAVACVAVPLAGLATIVPLPGGLGGVEFALGAFLVLLTDLSAGTAGAGIVLYRLASFGLMVGLGGAALLPGSLRIPLDPEEIDADPEDARSRRS